MTCGLGQACCFDELGSADTCHTGSVGNFNCPSNHLTLQCNVDDNCAGGSCCVIYSSSQTLKGTECRANCSASDAAPSCNPKATPTCTCIPLLDAYFLSGMASAPYDQYGQCN
jgi:hypothetical protein